MNMNQNPTKEELKSLTISRDDEAGHHMLWVSQNGDVYLDMIPPDLTPNGYAKSLKDQIRFRFETFQQSNDYVGKTAVADAEWMARLYEALVSNWQNGVRGYIDVI